MSKAFSPRLLPAILIIIASVGAPNSLSAQVDFREETIYFLLTTRFFDGDPSNNVPNEWSSYNPDPNINPTITDPQDVTWRGDFKGLIEKLGYIQDLGFTAIWITPIVHNRSPLDYHGYHAWDFTRVDPRLESPGATFQDLINAVHARGMKIVLDIVTNHSGRFGIKDHAEIMYNTDPNQPWGKNSSGNPLQDNPDWEYDGLTPNPDDGKIWSRANLARLPAPFNENLAAYNFPNTVSYVNTTSNDWFHHSGNGFAQGFDDTENLYYRALHEDTPDLNTGSATLRQYLLDAYRTYIEMGVDGFRWDTIKHMSREDVLWFLDEFKKIKPDLFIFGEVAQKRHELHNVEEINPHWYTWRGAVGNSEPSGMAVLDFYAMATFHLFEKGENFSNVMAAARYDHLYANPSELVTFLDNHDFGPNNDWNRRYGGNEHNLAAALNFMWTWRGIPSLYYGTEIQFKRGEYADIQYGGHQRSIDETGRAYFGGQFESAPNHTMYKHIRKLNAIRRAVPALQKGSWQWGGNGGGNGVGFIREHASSYAVVGLAKDGTVTFNFTGVRNGVYRDAVTGHEITVGNGSISFTVTGASAGVYVLDGPGLIGELGAGHFQSTATGGEGSGGSGGGGGGGTQTPAELGFDPNPPVAGQAVTITYNGFLNDQSQVNLYWGYDSWTNVTTTAMQRSGDTWILSMTVPTAVQTELNMVFNNGSGTWDNNNGNDYRVSVTSSGGGSNGGGDGDGGDGDGGDGDGGDGGTTPPPVITPDGHFTVFFNNTAGWQEPHVYAFRASGGEHVSWPGQSMTAPATGSDWYHYHVPDTFDRIIFNGMAGGNRQQTGNLERTTIGYYDQASGNWTATEPPNRRITFIVDVSMLQARHLFDPSLDGAAIRGTFNDWGTTAMQAVQDQPGRYRIQLTLNQPEGTQISYKYYLQMGEGRGSLVPGGSWEANTPLVDPSANPEGNRRYTLGTAGQNVQLTPQWFNEQDGLSYTLTGGAGWRFMSSPFSDASYLDLLAGLHTQGFTGAEFAGGNPALSNVLVLTAATEGGPQSWVSITDGNAIPAAGSGFAAGIFANDQPGVTGTFPKTRLVRGHTPIIQTVNAPVHGEGQFSLVGNPFGAVLDVGEATRNGLGDAIYVHDILMLDDHENPGGPQIPVSVMRTWNGVSGDLGSYRVAPFQSFLVHATQTNPTLSLPASARVHETTPYRGRVLASDDGAGNGTQSNANAAGHSGTQSNANTAGSRSPTAGKTTGNASTAQTSSDPVLALTVTGNAMYSSAWMHFNEAADAGLDHRDALKLMPFSPNYLLLQTYSECGTALDINHHPMPGDETLIPMDILTNRSGRYRIQLANNTLPADWTVRLHDTKTGESHLLTENTSLHVDLGAVVSGKSVPESGMPGRSGLVSAEGDAGEARFRLEFTSPEITSVPSQEGTEFPAQVMLYQNYPNPFNPTTRIRFDLSGSSQPVRLAVYDILGREVAVLVDGLMSPGVHLADFDASDLGSGVYVYRLETAVGVSSRRMTLIK
jgi:glycosidase